MMKEVKSQAKAGVEMQALWKALAKDLRFIIPKVIPNLVKEVEIIEGDGGLGSVLLFNFHSDVSKMNYQKENIVELDESLPRISLPDITTTSYQKEEIVELDESLPRISLPDMANTSYQKEEIAELDESLPRISLPDVTNTSYQKEKIVELDESLHRISLQILEGGYLNLGFSAYKTTFQLTAIGKQETSVDVIVEYESEVEESTKQSKTIDSTLTLIKCLESYILNGVS